MAKHFGSDEVPRGGSMTRFSHEKKIQTPKHLASSANSTVNRPDVTKCSVNPGSARDAAFSQTAEPAAPAGRSVGPNALAETGLDTPLTWTTSGTFIPYNHAGPSSALRRTVQEWMARMHAGIRVAKPPKDFVIHSWILRYANSLRSFNFLGNPVGEPVYSFTPYHLLTPAERRKLHNAPQYPRTSPIPSLYSSSISRMPLTFSQNAPYRPFIRRTSLDPLFLIPQSLRTVSQFDLFSRWDAIRSDFLLVEQCVPMPRTRDGLTQASFEWKDKLRCRGRNLEDLIDTVDQVFTFAYELGGVGRWYCHRHIERLLRGHDGNYFLGVDDELVGAVFELPFPDDCPSLGSTMARLSRHGVPVFGVQVVGSGASLQRDFVPGGWSDSDVNSHKMAVQSASLPSKRSRDIVFKQLEFIPVRPTPWIIKPAHGYPGSPDLSTPVELALADALYPPHNPLYTEEELCRKIKSFFGHGLFPVVPPARLSPRLSPRPSSSVLGRRVVSTTWHDGAGSSSDDEFRPHFEPPHQEMMRTRPSMMKGLNRQLENFPVTDRACQEIWERGHGKKKRQLSAHDYHIRLRLQSDPDAMDIDTTDPLLQAIMYSLLVSHHNSSIPFPPCVQVISSPRSFLSWCASIETSRSLGATSHVNPPPSLAPTVPSQLHPIPSLRLLSRSFFSRCRGYQTLG
ncbi:uncharacterized protein EI90DRAFT_3133638 [Cantharellus anzutake]|uniref:uncharacterized protein n=1 Tax=Cantharellus anzutake TaxID=1750568 RepID=UPI001903D512|nr:uncharacterized protein EI90DRAFT_3133638 [Cantharellus anzutake]KAF8317849.1 hypothetical protein EI90DRAFT_3133638 [Cantharellus anzutake]